MKEYEMISGCSGWRSFTIFLIALLPLSVVLAAVVGDFTGDNEVHFDDFIVFAKHYGTSQAESGFDARFDLDGDGQVGFSDFLTFASNFGATQSDLREDSFYLQQQIKHISDADLFAAVDLEYPGLEEVKGAVARQDYQAAYAAWGTYWDTRPGFAYVNSGNPFYTVEEARRVFSGTSYVSAADRVVAHNITGWGSVTIQHGPVVDFNAEYGQSGKYGFHYWGWSTPLLWAYLGTGNTRYLDAFDELFNQWYEQRDNVVGGFSHLDPIWYELGLGASRNRVFLDFYRLNRNRLSGRTHERMLKNFLGSARWLHELEEEGYRSGNWQVMGIYALAELGLNLPEFKESKKWISLGVYRMKEHLARDLYEDGCHSERCPSSYSTIVYRDPRNLAYLMEQFGGHEELVAELRPPLERTLTHWMYLLSPLGTQPAVNDGGRGKFDASIFIEGGRGFNRPDLLWVAKNILGADVNDAVTPPSSTSVDFRPSGFAVMRQDWTRESPYMVINYGPSGGGHSHADVLSFELFAYGEAMAVDAGIGVSYDDPLHRPWYITSQAHNMMVFEESNLDRSSATGEKPVWSSQAGMDYFSAEHRGYQSLGVWHRRHFLFVKASEEAPDAGPYFLIYDTFSSTTHSRKASFVLHSPFPLQRGGTALFSSEAAGLLTVTPDVVSIRQGKGMAHLGGVSSSGRKEIDWVSLDQMTTGAKRVDDLPVVLYPYKGSSPPGIIVRRTRTKEAPGTVYLTVSHRGTVDHVVIS
ncbi:MAG: heparinase II/III family protein, partial [bacterium]|nr:heparinase II/III family protein [bacterium]